MELGLKDRLNKFGQSHLYEHYESIINPILKAKFFEQLERIDYEQMHQIYVEVYLKSKEGALGGTHDQYAPIENVCTRSMIKEHEKELLSVAYASIARGEVGVCIMSGGQGTRLGFDFPKGMYNLKLDRLDLPLFGFFTRRLLRLMELVKQLHPESPLSCTNMIKLYLMTSEMNHQVIVEHFQQHGYYGYDPDAVMFFPQAGIPAYGFDGKIIIEAEGEIALAPGGNGAIYSEMRQKGVLAHMKERGVKYLHLGPVDNVLFKLADPLSLGYLINKQLEVVSAFIKKRSAEEKVGLHLQVNGSPRILEYSEVSKALKEAKDAQGDFIYSHGSRATTYFTFDFLHRITSDPATVQKINRKFHFAEKQIKCYDSTTHQSTKPQANNGIKFELFYFDVFEECAKFGLFETQREEEFAPLKNAAGDDSPETARQLLHSLHRKWAKSDGVTLEGEGTVEIDPLISYNGEGISEYLLKTTGSTHAKLPLHLAKL